MTDNLGVMLCWALEVDGEDDVRLNDSPDAYWRTELCPEPATRALRDYKMYLDAVAGRRVRDGGGSRQSIIYATGYDYTALREAAAECFDPSLSAIGLYEKVLKRHPDYSPWSSVRLLRDGNRLSHVAIKPVTMTDWVRRNDDMDRYLVSVPDDKSFSVKWLDSAPNPFEDLYINRQTGALLRTMDVRPCAEYIRSARERGYPLPGYEKFFPHLGKKIGVRTFEEFEEVVAPFVPPDVEAMWQLLELGADGIEGWAQFRPAIITWRV